MMSIVSERVWPTGSRDWAWVAVLGLLYWGSGLLGLLLSPEGLLVTAMWPPLGISLGLLFRRGFRLWPGMLLGEALLFATLEVAPLIYLMVGLSNSASVALVYFLLRRIRFDIALKRIRDLLWLFAASSLAVLVINLPLGAFPAIWIARGDLDPVIRLTTLSLWLGGDFLSYLLFAPLVWILRRSPINGALLRRVAEGALLYAALFTVLALLVFEDDRLFATSPSGFLLFPFVVWAGFRFGLLGAILTNLLVATMVLFEMTLPGRATGLVSMISYPLFLLLLAGTSLFLVVVNEERKERGDRLRARGVFFRSILDNLASGVLIRDADGRILFVNRYWAEFFGENVERLEGSVDPRFVFAEEETIPAETGNWERLLESPGHDARRRMSFSRRQIRFEEGAAPCVFLLMQDLTEAREAQERAQHSEVQLMAVIEGSEIGLWEWNLETGAMKRHDSWYRLLGYSREELNEVTDPWVKVGSAAEWERVSRYYRERLREGATSFEVEYQLRHRSGKMIWLLSRALVTARDALGRPRVITGIAVNITDSKLAEERLRVAKEAAESASEAKSFFLANISHEIRTPLNAILGMASILRETESSPEQLDYLETIIQSSESLSELITEVLDFSKIETGNLELDIQEFPLRACCEDAFGLFKARVAEKNLEYTFQLAQELDGYFMGDMQRLRQILVNLLSNAVKFTESGSVRMTVRPGSLQEIPAETRPEGGYDVDSGGRAGGLLVLFQVEDTGIGIAPEWRERVFESFTQGDPSTTRKYGGTGLGLSISRSLAKAMGGALWLDKTERQGCSFTLALWLQPIPDEPTFKETVESQGFEDNGPPVDVERRSLDTGNPFAGMAKEFPCRILVVEDNDTNRRVLTTLLSRYGYRTACVTNGQEAVELLQRKDFDLVLMDLRMPVMDGLTATRQIRKSLARDRQPRIVALTAHVVKGEQEKCRLSGMDDFLPKPLSPEHLREAIRKHYRVAATE